MTFYIKNENELEDIVKEGITIVDFHANWCGPCRMLSPVLDEFTEKYNHIKLAKVDVDENVELSRKFKISAIPALLIFKEGKLVASEIGFKTFDDLEELFEGISK